MAKASIQSLPALLRLAWHWEWLRLKRSPMFQGRLAARVLSALAVLYFLINLLGLSYFLDTLLRHGNPGAEVVALVNRHVLFYFAVVLVIRFVAEQLPRVEFRYFAALPIQRGRVILTYLLRVWAGKYNLVPLVAVVPFWLKNVLAAFPPARAGFWLAGFALTGLCFTFFGLVLRLVLVQFRWGILLLLALLAAAVALDLGSHAGLISAFSGSVFAALLRGDIRVLLPVVLAAVIAVVLAMRALRREFYWEAGG